MPKCCRRDSYTNIIFIIVESLSGNSLQRVNKHNKEVVLEQAEKDLSSVTAEYMSRVAKELQGDDFWKLRRAYSPGVQEYVEAATVIEFCKTGRLLTLADLNNDLSELSNLPTNSFKINLLDYLLGVGDLTGELMRLAISHVADGEVEVAKTICNFVRDLYKELSLVAPDMDDNSEMNKKMDTMLQSLVKIENACYNVHVRGSEHISSLDSHGQHNSYPGTLHGEE